MRSVSVCRISQLRIFHISFMLFWVPIVHFILYLCELWILYYSFVPSNFHLYNFQYFFTFKFLYQFLFYVTLYFVFLSNFFWHPTTFILRLTVLNSHIILSFSWQFLSKMIFLHGMFHRLRTHQPSHVIGLRNRQRNMQRLVGTSGLQLKILKTPGFAWTRRNANIYCLIISSMCIIHR